MIDENLVYHSQSLQVRHNQRLFNFKTGN